MPNSSSPPHALPPPMTVGRYVRENFKPIASKLMWWAVIVAPGSIALKTRSSHFSMLERVGMILLALFIAAVAITVLVSLCLSVAGWFKLHTRIRPIIPASIAMVVGILAYVLVVNFY